MTYTPEARARVFRYSGYDLHPEADLLACRYRLDDIEFREEITFPAGGDWAQPAVAEAARLVFLLAGVSYYKAGAPPVIDLGDTAVTDREREFLREFYVDGLGEYAYRGGLDLTGIEIAGPRLERRARVAYDASAGRPLVPFGGGMDSLVTVELLRPRTDDAALFISNRPHDRFAAIEQAAGAVGWPVLRSERQFDEKLLRSKELGYLNGHVPITGILSAVAVLAAILDRRDAVVMSNEWSASSGTLKVDGRVLNHQYSKSEAFEEGLRDVLAGMFDRGPSYFSLLRPFSELWIARELHRHPRYLDHFRSCNEAFYADPALRLDRWCGTCEKCCFVDLILAPFVAEPDLRRVFNGNEPLADPDLLPTFRSLVDLVENSKPWECVGDVTECRVAVALAAGRADRAGSPVLATLAGELGPLASGPAPEELMRPMGRHFVEERYAPDALLV
jgi:UDP-N-acetyl-alpha-D-muramoyl-L-alanyl-L-glutamate epimerase